VEVLVSRSLEAPRGVLAYCSAPELCLVQASCARLHEIVDVRAAALWQRLLHEQRALEGPPLYSCASVNGSTPDVRNAARPWPEIRGVSVGSTKRRSSSSAADSSSDSDDLAATTLSSLSAKARYIAHDALRRSWSTLRSGRCGGAASATPKPYAQSALAGHTDYVRCLHLAGSRIITAASSTEMHDCSVKVWCARTGNCVRTFVGHRGPILALAVFDCASRAISASEDRTLRLLELNSGTTTASFVGHTAGVHCVCVAPNGREFASGSDDRTVRVWDMVRHICLHVLALDAVPIGVQYIGRASLVAYRGNGVCVWDRAVGFDRGAVSLPMLAARGDARGGGGGDRIGPDVGRGGGGGEGCSIVVCACYVAGHGDGADAAGGHLAVGGSDGTVAIVRFDAESVARAARRGCAERAQPLSSFVAAEEAHSGAVWCLQWISTDTLVSGGKDGSIAIWRRGASGVALVRRLLGHSAAVVTLQATATVILSGSFDHTVRLWDVATGRCLSTCAMHTASVWSVAMNTSYIVSVGLDAAVGVRRLHTCGDCGAEEHTVAAIRSTRRVRHAAVGLRREGNAAYRAGRHCEAVDAYTRALALGDDPLLLSNRAAALTAAGRLEEALRDAQRCCELRPGWHKGHFRLLRARCKLRDAAQGWGS
jgi:WD40 repeat protein